MLVRTNHPSLRVGRPTRKHSTSEPLQKNQPAAGDLHMRTKKRTKSRRPHASVKSRQQTVGPPTEADKQSPTTICRDETAHTTQHTHIHTTQPQATTPTQLADNAAHAGTPGRQQTATHHTTTPRQKDPLKHNEGGTTQQGRKQKNNITGT
jgi:hypothetical protein